MSAETAPQTYSATTFQRVNVAASSVTVSGNVTLTGENGLVRVVAETADGTQWLIAEANSLLHDAGVTWDRECLETCHWPSARQIVSLAVIVENAQFTGTWTPSTTAARRLRAPTDPVSALNAALTRKGYLWRAATTPISQLSYQAKRARLGVPAHLPLPDLHGLEYYRGGIFSERPPLAASRDIRRARSLLPTSLDYRDWQGADWTTPTRDQLDCGGCVAFGFTSAIETTANLYLNQHLNLDLAEQQVVSCSPYYESGVGGCRGEWPSDVADYLRTQGIPNERCFPYRGIDALGRTYTATGFAPVLCTETCTTPTYRVTVPTWDGFTDFANGKAEALKGVLWRYGGVAFTRPPTSWGYTPHQMAILGYGMIQAGDEVLAPTDSLNEPTIVPIDSAMIGSTYWIIKNSWGDEWGEHGFMRLADPGDYIYYYDEGEEVPYTFYTSYYGFYAATAITTTPALSIACTDNDHDGYFFWGISAAKAATCPAASQAARDCDDSDATQGAVTADFQCTPTTPNTVTVQIVNDFGDGGTVTPGTVSLHEFVPITQTVTARPNYRIREILKNGVAQPLTASQTFTYQTDPTTQTLRVAFTPTFPFCVDADFDGFALWGGAATKPPYCPSHTALAEDCDDTTPRKGAWVNGVCSDQTQDYRVMIGASDHGTVSPSGDVWRSSGDSLTIQMTPRAGYVVTGLVVDGVVTAAAATYTFPNITTAHTFYATFGED